MPRKPQKTYSVGSVTLRTRPGYSRRWYARYTTPSGERKEVALETRDLKVAMIEARKLADEIDRGDYANIEQRHSRGKISLGEFMEEFRAGFMGWSPASMASNNYILNAAVEAFGAMPLNRISSAMLQKFLADQLAKGRTKATVNRHRSALSMVFKTAIEWGYLSVNPVEKTRFLKEDQKVPDPLTQEQEEAFLAALPEYAKRAAILFLDTGVRRMELFRLQWKDVDFDRRHIVIQQTKNKKFRVIPMTDRVYHLLQEMRENTAQDQVVTGPGDRPIVDSLKKVFARAARDAQIPGTVGHHRLRHSFATQLRRLGVPLPEIQELLGHQSLTMVLRYAQADAQNTRSAIEALSRHRDESVD